MQPEVMVLVLGAAVMHAVWHALIKSGGDKFLTYCAVNVVAGVVALCLLPIVPAPSAESLVWLALSVLLHQVYKLFLINTYRFGDLSRTFPIARGTAPLLVAVGAAILANERLSAGQLAAMVVISGGIIALSLGEGRGSRRDVLLALATGAVTASYTVVDGLGARASSSPLAFVAWIYVFDAILFPLAALYLRRGRIGIFIRREWKGALVAGILSILSYGAVVWALSLGAMGPIAALREVSVVVAVIIGTRLLGEPMGRRRIMSATAVCLGIVMSTFVRQPATAQTVEHSTEDETPGFNALSKSR